MKCPKCGFNSFEFLDNCKKCGNNLMAFKRNFGISPIVFAPRQFMKAAPQEPSVETLHEEVPLEAAGIEPSGIEPEEAFTWDIPALSETATESDSKFAGFDLDFINGDKKPAEQEAAFSFDDEPVMESSDAEEAEKAAPAEEFSFYEQTLELGEEAVATGMEEEQQGESDPFGQTGIIGELMPEQLQETATESQPAGGIYDFSPESDGGEHEFVLEDFSGNVIGTNVKKIEPKKDATDFSDFDKDFESIFQTDENPDNGKTEK